METRLQLSIAMDNRPGQLARLCRALAQAEINLSGICVVDSADVSIIRLLASDAAAAKRALNEAGFVFAEQKVIVLELENEPGALAHVAERLGQSGININYVYGTSGAGQSKAIIVIQAAEPERAAQALR